MSGVVVVVAVVKVVVVGDDGDVDMSSDRDNEVTRTSREFEDAGSGDGVDGDEDMVMGIRRRMRGHEIPVVSRDVSSDEADEGVDSTHEPRRSARQRDLRAKAAQASASGGCVDASRDGRPNLTQIDPILDPT